jgi:hypothetical protein
MRVAGSKMKMVPALIYLRSENYMPRPNNHGLKLYPPFEPLSHCIQTLAYWYPEA